MKRIQSNNHSPLLRVLGTAVLAAALVAGPGLAGIAFAVEPSPSPTPESNAITSPSPVPETSAAAPVVTAPSTATPPPAQAPAPSTATAPSTNTDSDAAKAAMAEAIGIGGAEMGQRSARVAASSPSEGLQKLSTEALSTEGTWMPTFGVQGLDVSSHQPSVDWQQQWNMGARFAYVKASEGNYYTSPTYASQYQGSRNVGMIRGAYHFAIPNWSSGADQARYFVQNGGGWTADGYTLPPVLDFEFNPYEGRTINGVYFGNTCYGMSPSQLTSWVRDFGNTMLSMTGRLPAIYTNTSWWRQCLGDPAGFGDYPLWVAAYPSSPTNNAGPVPASWSSFSMWQYSSTGPLAGDSNVWNGDYAGLQRFAGAAFPIGSFDDLSISRSGSEVSLRARGWSVDLANVPASNQTHVYVTAPDGSTKGYPWTANTSRPDVNAAFGYGMSHGFDGLVKITKSGTYKACAYSIGAFGNTPLGCKTVSANGVEAPIGSFDALGQVRTPDKVSLQLRGWGVDLANPSGSSYVDTYVTAPDGTTTGHRMTANAARPDVHTITGLGSNHGFDYQVPIKSPGTYKACSYAIGQNSNLPLGCKTIAIEASRPPIGNYDEVSVTQAPNVAGLQVSGWALDPAQPSKSITVSVYLVSKDGSGGVSPGTVFTANLKRPDVNKALETLGDHGFQASLPLKTVGAFTVCVQAIGVEPISAGPTLLGCKDILVAPTPPTMGHLDGASVQVTSGQAAVQASGWTLDPVFPASSNPVHIYITSPDGTTKGHAFSAQLKRTDVNLALQTVGDHGFNASVPVTQRGQYKVCAYGVAVSVLSSNNSLLGCQTLNY
ncbi:lysozyme [Pseudarthrobacter sulfonivorans]|uniref:lysozyme n=1 Tax=Pseudarthrobacter sulfonivorans TaxID=121292 RepID=UPI0035943B85